MSLTVKSVSIATSIIGLAAVGYLFATPASPITSVSNSTQQCEQLLSNAETGDIKKQCVAAANEVTWTNWVKGESRSAQFHFIDLFELLFSSKDASQQKQRFNQQSSL
ncbi:hypothetical protein DEU29_10627 [Idiomarina aquatica]|jgi:hypothetical protein|uniref:Uncharacterized protein n=1 Tax=Idiomarina aquatica TaxID=1327752 RepID=A0A4R6PI95_9GAMM|nr:hypothetical protein [Idiomarina aquatica]TDP37565.1 hypothetical protein DEU29_10627 [Idiomarina aquatica]